MTKNESIVAGVLAGAFVALLLGVIFPVPALVFVAFLIAYSVTGGIAGYSIKAR